MAKFEPSESLMLELQKVLESPATAEISVGLSEMYLLMQACQLMLTFPPEKLNGVLRAAYEAIGRKYQGFIETKVSREFYNFCELGWDRGHDV